MSEETAIEGKTISRQEMQYAVITMLGCILLSLDKETAKRLKAFTRAYIEDAKPIEHPNVSSENVRLVMKMLVEMLGE